MSPGIPGPGAPPVNPPVPPVDIPTWLCTFLVQVDLPVTFSVQDMEGAVAFSIVSYINGLGHQGNCSAQLTATQGNASVANPTPTNAQGGNPNAGGGNAGGGAT